MLSAPPDTATARDGWDSYGPSLFIAAANRAMIHDEAPLAEDPVTSRLPATGLLCRRRHAIANIGTRLRKIGSQAVQRVARRLLLVDRCEGSGETQQGILRT